MPDSPPEQKTFAFPEPKPPRKRRAKAEPVDLATVWEGLPEREPDRSVEISRRACRHRPTV